MKKDLKEYDKQQTKCFLNSSAVTSSPKGLKMHHPQMKKNTKMTYKVTKSIHTSPVAHLGNQRSHQTELIN